MYSKEVIWHKLKTSRALTIYSKQRLWIEVGSTRLDLSISRVNSSQVEVSSKSAGSQVEVEVKSSQIKSIFSQVESSKYLVKSLNCTLKMVRFHSLSPQQPPLNHTIHTINNVPTTTYAQTEDRGLLYIKITPKMCLFRLNTPFLNCFTIFCTPEKNQTYMQPIYLSCLYLISTKNLTFEVMMTFGKWSKTFLIKNVYDMFRNFTASLSTAKKHTLNK